jgi:hypothetical protein
MKRFLIMGALRDASLGFLAATTAWLIFASSDAWPQVSPDVATPTALVLPAAASRLAPAQKIVPDRGETAEAAFDKLDIAQRGFVTFADVASLDGFDSAFMRADANRDGRLDIMEFERAWRVYTVAPQLKPFYALDRP